MLSNHVSSKMAGLLTGVDALATFVWFFPSMNTPVSYQRTSLSGREVALITLERVLSRMDPHVVLQVTSMCASEVALRATQSLCSRMFPQMFPEATRFFTGIGTLCAAERFDP